MGFVLLVGCILVAYCIPFALFFFLLAHRPQYVIVFLAAAFFWLVGIFFSSILWAIITPLSNTPAALIVVTVIIEEILRLIFLRQFAKSERSFSVVSINAISFPLTDLYSSIAAGVGFGGMASVLLYAPVFSSSLDPGVLFLNSCTNLSAPVISAWLSLLFELQHIAWFIIAFHAFRIQSVTQYFAMTLMHLGATLFTLINQTSNGCTITLIIEAAWTALAILYAARVIHSADYRSKLRSA